MRIAYFPYYNTHTKLFEQQYWFWLDLYRTVHINNTYKIVLFSLMVVYIVFFLILSCKLPWDHFVLKIWHELILMKIDEYIVLDFPQEVFSVPRSHFFLSPTQQYQLSHRTAIISLVDDRWLIHESWSMVFLPITYQQWIYAFIPSLVYGKSTP